MKRRKYEMKVLLTICNPEVSLSENNVLGTVTFTNQAGKRYHDKCS